MGDGMQGSTEGLFGAAATADTGAIDLNSMLTNLMNQIEPMLYEWKGKGGSTFENVRLAVEAEMKTLTGALSNLGSKIGDNTLMYIDMDEDASVLVGNAGSEAGSITSCLNGHD